jgi:hypothetical protein
VLAASTVVEPVAAAPTGEQAIVPPPVEAQIESRLNQMTVEALSAGADSQVRALVRNVVGRQFDGDTNALLSTVIAEAEASGIVNPAESWWQSLKSKVANFVVDGFRYDPQIYIPNYGEGALPQSRVELAIAPADETATAVPGYWLDANGNVQNTPSAIDETYVATREVWVLSVNERITSGVPLPVAPPAPARKAAPEAGPAGPAAPARAAGRDARALAACNPTGLRNNQGLEYLQRWRVPNRNSFGGLFEGKREMKLIILGTSGSTIKTVIFPKVKRRNIDEWQNSDMFITTWDRAVWGDVMAYQWFELDGGRTVSSQISIPIQGGGTISTTVTTQQRDDEGGGTAVLFSESTFIEYDTGKVRFNLCSQGGDGGTGNANLACGAIASASSTFGGYSAARATDCVPNTGLGGAYSWANAQGTYPPNNPQWLQADLGTNKTFRRAVVYTSQGYPIRDFDLQVWNGATFVTVGMVRNNTQLTVTVPVSAQTTRLVRILGRSGPNHQQTYVRINELELYAV